MTHFFLHQVSYQGDFMQRKIPFNMISIWTPVLADGVLRNHPCPYVRPSVIIFLKSCSTDFLKSIHEGKIL